jgi:hypothetical protein
MPIQSALASQPLFSDVGDALQWLDGVDNGMRTARFNASLPQPNTRTETPH